MVLRFFAFYDRYTDFDHGVTEFLNDYMGDFNDKLPAKRVVALFETTFKFLAKELPNGIVRGLRNSITPVNLFEAISVGTALAFDSTANPKKNVLKKLLNDDGLKQLTSAGTNSRRMVVGRIEYVRDKLL